MNYITRNLENVVKQVTKEYPVVLVTGPRQVDFEDCDCNGNKRKNDMYR